MKMLWDFKECLKKIYSLYITFCNTEYFTDAYTCSWKKVVPIFVEGDSHDSVCQVKSFLNTISMMNIYVNVQNSGMVSVTNTQSINGDRPEKHTRSDTFTLRNVVLLE